MAFSFSVTLALMETDEEKSKRWFYRGMNDKERIEYLMDWVDRLIKENARLRIEKDKRPLAQ